MFKFSTQIILICGLLLIFYNSTSFKECKSIKQDIKSLYFDISSNDISFDRINFYELFDERIFETNSQFVFETNSDDDAIVETFASCNIPGINIETKKYILKPDRSFSTEAWFKVGIPDSSIFINQELILSFQVKYANVNQVDSKSTKTTAGTYIERYYNIKSYEEKDYTISGIIKDNGSIKELLIELEVGVKSLRLTFLIYLTIVIFIVLIVGLFINESGILEFSFFNYIIWNIFLFVYLLFYNISFFPAFFIQLAVVIVGFLILALLQKIIGRIVNRLFPNIINLDNMLE